MFWRFGFSSTSTLDTLLDRPNVTLEEVLDEDELLQECKTQNQKLINYLQQPRVLKRLFEHVVGTADVGGPGGKEWEEKVRFKYPYICSEVLSSDIYAIIETTLEHKEDLLVPFWDAILARSNIGNPPTVTQHQHPLFAADAQPLKPGTSNAANTSDAQETTQEQPSELSSQGAESSSVGVLGLEVKPSNDEGSTVTSARDNGPGKNVLAGYWAKVNGVFLDKKPREMIDFIKSLPDIVELFVAHMETPAVVDLLYRIIQCEEVVPNIGVIDWLSSENLMPSLIELLSPCHSTDMHNTVSELLKAIIALSAPSPANLTQNGGTEAFGFGGADALGSQPNGPIGGVDNRLVRELASETIVRKMVSFMLDASLPTRLSHRLSEAAALSEATAGDELDALQSDDVRTRPSAIGANRNTLSALKEGPTSSSDDSAVDDEDDDLEFSVSVSRRTPLNPRDTPASEQTSFSSLVAGHGGFDHHRDSTATIRPSGKALAPIRAPQIAVTPESCTSTLVTCIGILIELIRKNNSDYFEQHLFHTLRTHLLQRQQEIAERKANKTIKTEDEAASKDEQDEASDAAKSSADANTSPRQDAQDEDDDDEMEGMEEAMAELSDKLGIVHLGPMLNVLCERLPDFQQLIERPRADAGGATDSTHRSSALTFERYRITELYAELLHCSNMALLNRSANEGPQYSDEGVLLGGIEGLQVLARTLQGTDAASESGHDHNASESKATAQQQSAQNDGDDTLEAESSDNKDDKDSQVPSKGRGHTRQSSTVGGTSGSGNTGSEDTDDEALLSEVSLSDLTIEAGDASEKAPSTSTITSALTSEEGGKESGSKESDDVEEAATGEDEEIKSVLSHLSLADLTSPSPAPSGPPSPIDEKRDYVVGDKLKKKFLECDVIPTILDLFFEFPWNNFLHNVVYDILQQFFNGRMDVGLNRRLTLAVFDQGQMTEKIVAGHERNEESLKKPRRIRMGYMGHMHLIAEETVKLLERYPQEIGRFVESHLTAEWTQFVNETLKENREKEAAPLAGGRPQMMHSLNFNTSGGGGGVMGTDGDLGGNDGSGTGSDAFASYLSSQIGSAAGESDDDDSDEDTNWLSHDLRSRGNLSSHSGSGFDDSFNPDHGSQAYKSRRGHDLDDVNDSRDDDDDDDWGPFADSSASAGASGSVGGSSAQAYLTPADWAADFQREQSAADARRFDDDGSSTASASERAGEDEDEDGEGRTRSRSNSDSSSSNENQTNGVPFVDLLDSASIRATDAVAAAHARRPSLDNLEGVVGELLPSPTSSSLLSHKRRTSSSSGSTSPAAAEAISADEPLGPGIATDAQADPQTGLIERTIDGKTVKVPLDDVALMAQSQANEEAIVDDDDDDEAVEV